MITFIDTLLNYFILYDEIKDIRARYDVINKELESFKLVYNEKYENYKNLKNKVKNMEQEYDIQKAGLAMYQEEVFFIYY